MFGSSPNFAAARSRMVREQLAAPGRDIRDPRVLEAMASVPRHEFVPPELRAEAYEDKPLPIGFGQTISQPYVVAFMLERLHPRPTDHVLEVGTGCGYQAAVLARIVAEVWSVEIVEPLARQATADLARLGFNNVHVRARDGWQGWPPAAPFDAIIVACAAPRVPPALVDQLADRGRMILPVDDGPTQQLRLLLKSGGQVTEEDVLPVRFVPMTGGEG